MKREILNQFKKIYDKQDILGTIHNKELFEELDISEVHCLDVIGKMEEANGTIISNELGMTRGGASKLISKLFEKNFIIKYKKEDNKKEIYYELTDKGRKIYEIHKLAHEDWEKRDMEFLDKIDSKEIEVVSSFLRKFDSYLEREIKEREE